jgi:diguanylate cyclase (GGDEF)-like protein
MDIFARWGGDEFAVLVETGSADARSLAERFQEDLADLPPGEIPATISIGIAECDPEKSTESLVRRADQALYLSKADGRNRITVAD